MIIVYLNIPKTVYLKILTMHKKSSYVRWQIC